MSIHPFLERLFSLKFLLIFSFILLMIVSGLLGYILTATQSQISMKELAENNVYDLAHSVVITIRDKFNIGHQMNLMESYHVMSQHKFLNNCPSDFRLDTAPVFLLFVIPPLLSEKNLISIKINISVGRTAHTRKIFSGLLQFFLVALADPSPLGSFQLKVWTWPTVWSLWRPITISNIRTTPGVFFYTGLLWDAKYMIAINTVQNFMTFINFNGTICKDTVNFPGSNCSLFGAEAYELNATTYEVNFAKSLFINYPVNVTDLPNWNNAVANQARKNWTWSAEDPFSQGYSDVFILITPLIGTKLFMEINAAIVDAQGRWIGVLAKEILLSFIGDFLLEITTSNKILVNNGRAFCFEIGNRLLTGASHGNLYRLNSSSLPARIRPDECTDPVIRKAGSEMTPYLSGRNTKPFTVFFEAEDRSYVCAAEPLIDQFGLAWTAAVALSLTDLFRDINAAANRMLAITAAAIFVLSVSAGLSISFLVTRPLSHLSLEMAAVSEMDLENVNLDRRSLFLEIALMQRFFHKMVANLKEFRTFLPDAILFPHSGNSSGDFDALPGGPKPSSPKSPNPTAPAIPPVTSVISESDEEYSAAHPRQRTETTANVSSEAAEIGTISGSRALGDLISEKTASLQRVQTTYSSRKQTAMVRRKSMHRQVGMLSKRTVSVLHVDIKSFHELVAMENVLLSTHSAIMQKVAESVQLNGGICSPIMGDKILAFWNVKSMRSDHAILCITAALQVYRTLRVSNNNASRASADALVDTTSSRIQASVRIACTMGPASFGTLGTATSRAFTVISAAIPRGALLQKLAKLIPFGVACDGIMHERIQYDFRDRLVAMTRAGDAHCPIQHQVFEVLGPRDPHQVKEDEWMYQLRGQEAHSAREADLTIAVRALFSGQLPSARKHFTAYAQATPRSGGGGGGGGAGSGLLTALAEDPVVAWYQGHAEEVQQLVHPKWGMSLPMSVLLPPGA